MTKPAVAAALAALAALAACEVIPNDRSAAKQDTGVVAPSASATPIDSGTGATSGVPAVPSDSASRVAGTDSGIVRLHPERPTRGGVLFAFAEAIAVQDPRCSWKGAPIPCHRLGGGVLATIPLPADEPAGRYTLTFDRPHGRISREVEVADRSFERELIFLNDSLMALVRQIDDIRRDARALRGILATQSPDRHWSGEWRQPARGGRTSGYGVERFYYPASDSTRSITLGGARAGGSFGADTTSPARGAVPSWRHSGVDIGVARGTGVVAPAGGVVVDAGDYTLSGRTLVIDHGQGVVTTYFHLDTALVRRGDVVRAGRTVGRVGSSGLSTGPHLHYGVYVHGRDVEPAAWYAMPAFARGTGTASPVAAGAER
jgi:murein DD-endopeptidase MepM/ murein hydrolase activator NlpD